MEDQKRNAGRQQTHTALGTTHRKTRRGKSLETEYRLELTSGREMGAGMTAEWCGVSLGLVAHTCNPSASGAATESQDQGQPSSHRETFLKTVMGFLLKVITRTF